MVHNILLSGTESQIVLGVLIVAKVENLQAVRRYLCYIVCHQASSTNEEKKEQCASGSTLWLTIHFTAKTCNTLKRRQVELGEGEFEFKKQPGSP